MRQIKTIFVVRRNHQIGPETPSKRGAPQYDTFGAKKWPTESCSSSRHTYKYFGKQFVLESLDYKALFRSQRSHPEHACLNPPLGEPSRRLSLRSLLSSPSPCSTGSPPTITSRQNLQHCFKINMPTLVSRYIFPH